MAFYLVTGGCGFIGANLTLALKAAGHSVRVLDDLSTGRKENLPPDVELLVASITDAEAVAQAMDGIDGCFHLASDASVIRSVSDWVGSHTVNMTGFIQVLDQAHRAADGPVPVVYASSAAVYGDAPRLPISETARPRPLSAYAADKVACELHARVAGGLHGIPTFGLRFFNVYGPGQAADAASSGVVSIFTRNLLDDRPLTVYGDGSQVRDYVYVADACAFLTRAMERVGEDAPLANVCSGKGTALSSVIRTLAKATGKEPEVFHKPARAGEILASIGNPSRADNILGLSAKTSFDIGIDETVAWARRNHGARA